MVIEELTTKLGFKVDPEGLDKGKQSLGNFKKWAVGIGAASAAAFGFLAKTGIDAAMTMEGISAQFTVMTGSAERAQGLIQQIADFAAKTPFTKLGLSDAGKTLMAFGIEAEKVVPTLRMLGDVAGADQNRLNSLALVFGQIQSAGRLTGGDLLQLINQGFNPLNTLAKETGKSMAQLKDEMSKGMISAEDVARAFKLATSDGGLFFGNLEAQSQTLAGKMSTLKDNVETALQNMAEAFFPLLKQLADMAIAIDWTPIVQSVQKVVPVVTGLTKAVIELGSWLKHLYPLLVLVFGAKIQMMIKQAVMSTNAYAAAQAFLASAHARAAAAAGGQATAIGTLKASMLAAGGVAKKAGAAMAASFTAMLNPLNLALAGFLGIKELYDYFITDATAELKKDFSEVDKEMFKESAFGGPEGEMKMRESQYRKLQKQYKAMLKDPNSFSQTAMDKAHDDYENAKKLYQEGLGLYKQVRGVEWASVKAKSKASAGVQQTITESSKTIKVDNQFDFKIDAPQGKDTRTGLTASDVAQLANQAIDAAFNIRLKSLIVGAM